MQQHSALLLCTKHFDFCNRLGIHHSAPNISLTVAAFHRNDIQDIMTITN